MADLTLTETPQWDATITVPVPGDAVRAGVTDPGSVRKGFQRLTNRASYGRPSVEQGLGTSLIPEARVYVDEDNATVFAMGPLAFWTSSTLTAYATHANTTAVPTGLVAGTNYYLYLRYNAGAVALEISATSPDAASVFKTGDKTRRYVGCVVTYDSDGMGTAKFCPAVQERGRVAFGNNGATINGQTNPLKVLGSTAGNSAWHAQPLSLPANVVAADLYVQAGKSASASAGIVAARRSGETNSAVEMAVCGAATADAIVDILAVTGPPPVAVALTGALVGDTVKMVRRVIDSAAGTGAKGLDIRTKFEATISVNGQIQYTGDAAGTGSVLNGETTFFALSRGLPVETNGAATLPLDALTQGIDYYADTGITIRSLVVTGLYL